MKFMDDKFHKDVALQKEKFEGLDAAAKKSGLASVRFPNQTKYVIIALAPDGEWLPPNAGLEKFMKYIVQDCINVIEDAVNRRLPASTYTDLIKSHFEPENKNVK